MTRTASSVHGTRILVVSWGLPPFTSGSAVIVGNLAKQFSRSEMVVVGSKAMGFPPVEWRESWPKIERCSISAPREWRGQRWIRWLQTPTALLRVLWIARQQHCSAVLAVFPTEGYLFIGYAVARLLGIDFFPYFHNTYFENRSGLAQRVAGWFQQRVFKAAKHVFVMSEGMVRLYRDRYPKLDCSALIHSFNEPVPEFQPPPRPSATPRVAILGNINEACREATQRFHAALSNPSRAHLDFITGVPRSRLKDLGLFGENVSVRSVSRDHVIAALQECELVFLPHGFSGGLSPAEYQTIFPTRTIEYLICGRPILAHAPANSFLSSFLKENECALVVDRAEATAVREGLERLVVDGDLRDRLVRNALRAARQFYAPAVSRDFRNRLGMADPK